MYSLLWLVVASFLALVTGQGDKYTDENRPYKFGFNIEGHQHRKEEKDEKGIIKGEYGFITADGYYRVTVYATDENGDFKIISMKNYYVGFPPGDPTTTPPPSPSLQNTKQLTTTGVPRISTQLNLVSSTRVPATAPTAAPVTTPKSLLGRGGLACSSCFLPPTTTRAPPLPRLTPIGPVPIRTPLLSNTAPPTNNNGLLPAAPAPGPQPQNTRQSNPAPAGPLSPLTPNNKNTVVTGAAPQITSPDGQKTKPAPNRPGSTPSTLQAGKQAQYQPNTSKTGLPPPPSGPVGNSHIKPTISTVRGGTSDNSSNRAPTGDEKEGLPPGVTTDDIKNLLYRFNYTVGFHGHHEDGYRNGDKSGDYFVNSRNGDSRRVQYIANEFGYQPNITLVRLDENDVARPREDTEKEYGLKGYEFKWFYRK